MRTLKQVHSSKWQVANSRDYIYRDDFGMFQVSVNGFCEVTRTFEQAIAIINDEKYYK